MSAVLVAAAGWLAAVGTGTAGLLAARYLIGVHK